MVKENRRSLSVTVAYALFAFSASSLAMGGITLLPEAAHAASDGNGQGSQGGNGSQGGGSDNGGNGSQGGGSDNGGKGAPSADSEGKGPEAGSQGKPDSSGKPAWSQEGIPEVELGRLSVARSPDKVLDAALAEVLANWNPANSTLYSMSAAEFADYVKANWDTISIVDSPLQNLALMDALLDGTLNLSSINVSPASTIDLAAIFLGAASDKTVPISTDTAIAMNIILELGLTSTQVETLADKAEAVRQAILEAHG